MALVSLDTRGLAVSRNRVLEGEQLERDVQHQPVEQHSQQVADDAVELDQCKREVVLVVPEDPVVVLVAVVLEEDSVDEDLRRSEHEHENEIVSVLEGNGSRESRGHQVSDHYEQRDELEVEESLNRLGESLLDLVTVFE